MKIAFWAFVSWVGRILVEFGSGTKVGIAGGVLDSLNIALVVIPLALACLAVKHMAGTDKLEDLGGLADKSPLTAGVFIISGFALAGIPPFSGWWSEYHIFMVASELKSPALAFALIVASALTLAFVLRAFSKVFYGELRIPSAKSASAALAPAAVLAVLCILLGVFPELIMPWVYSFAG